MTAEVVAIESGIERGTDIEIATCTVEIGTGTEIDIETETEIDGTGDGSQEEEEEEIACTMPATTSAAMMTALHREERGHGHQYPTIAMISWRMRVSTGHRRRTQAQ